MNDMEVLITSVFLQLEKGAEEVFGGLDAIKVRSCMTLFNEVADDDLFEKVLEKHYQEEKDEMTINRLYPPTGNPLQDMTSLTS